MAVLTMLFRRMMRNRWLVLGLLAGMILCTALTGSMPIYKDAIMQRMLIKELEKFHVDTGIYPGNMTAAANLGFGPALAAKQGSFIDGFDRYWDRLIAQEQEQERLSLLEYIQVRETARLQIHLVDPGQANDGLSREASLVMRSGLERHVRLIDGRFPAKEPVDGVYEVLVTDNALVKMKTVIGSEFVTDDRSVPEPIRLRPVGVIAERDLNDLYWNQSNLNRYDNAFFLNESLFTDGVLRKGIAPLNSAGWFASFDYAGMDLDDAVRLSAIKEETELFYKERFRAGYVVLAAEESIARFHEREETLKALLWSLNVPLYTLIVFYMYMVARLVVERQRPEMAVLTSRGAGRRQIVALYAIETAILAGISFLIGPFVGSWFTAILGSSDSFLSFVQRKALSVEVSVLSYLFSGAAALFAFAVTIVPVVSAAKIGIVEQKRQSARQEQRSLWHKFGFDFILLGVSLYGMFAFRRRMEELIALGLDGKELAVDPLLFVAPSLFILGFGLLLLRLYPWLVKAVFRLGRRRWSASTYSAFVMVGRQNRQYHALMLFLILTIGTGMYNAGAARTINQNLEEQIWYERGGDIALSQTWAGDAPILAEPGSEDAALPEKVHYTEPPFDTFESLPGVERAARVFTKEAVTVQHGNEGGTARLMGIDTDDFGAVAWMKDGLLAYHFYDYLNLIATDPHAVLVSDSLARKYELSPGDTLQVSWGGEAPMEVTVYGFVEYFPSFNPNLQPMLIVGHLETIQNELALEPYSVWIRMKSSRDREAFYKAIEEKNMQIAALEDTREAILDSRNDPFRMAMNGVMSLGFILSLSVTFIGFLLYWMLSLQGRILQLGIFRAMGISQRQMIGMLSMEQLLTSGAGFVIGMICGSVASLLFVPLLQLSFDPGKIVPPFEVVMEHGDTIRLIVITVMMLIVALSALVWLLKRLKIHQAVKLGED